MISKNELRMVDNWDFNYIDQLVKSGEEESIRLEYKSGKWLEKTDKGKCKLKKWVTSFANSAGGFLVIGIPEKKINGKCLPDIPDGIDQTTFGGDIKKWIEDVIANGIFPHLNPIPKIKIIPMLSGTNKEIVVMWIPQTIAVIHKVAHKGKDYYFHRHETQVLPLDEWEIRALLFGRTPPQVLDLEWGENLNVRCKVSGNERVIFHDKFVLRLINNGFGTGKNIQIGIIFPPQINLYDPRYELMEHIESEPEWALKKIPIRTRTEDNVFSEIIPPQFKQFFRLKGQYFVIKINDTEVIHSADSRNYFFNLKIKDYKQSTEVRSNLGAYILSEFSEPRFFGIEIVINSFNEHRQTADLNVNVQKYTEDKIPIAHIQEIVTNTGE